MKKIELDREVLESCVKRGLSQLEIAVELNTSQAVVQARLQDSGAHSKRDSRVPARSSIHSRNLDPQEQPTGLQDITAPKTM